MRIIIESDSGPGAAAAPVVSTTGQSQGSLGAPAQVNAGAAPGLNGGGGAASAGGGGVISAAGTSVDAGQAPPQKTPAHKS